MMAENAFEEAQPSPPRLFAVIPGGHRPTADEVALSMLILGALAFIVLVRRGFRPVLTR